jgi:hypothetical protein
MARERIETLVFSVLAVLVARFSRTAPIFHTQQVTLVSDA